jgi:hypothetical protein
MNTGEPSPKSIVPPPGLIGERCTKPFSVIWQEYGDELAFVIVISPPLIWVAKHGIDKKSIEIKNRPFFIRVIAQPQRLNV